MKTTLSTYSQVAPDTYAVVRIVSVLFCAALPVGLSGCNDCREHDAGVYGAVGVSARRVVHAFRVAWRPALALQLRLVRVDGLGCWQRCRGPVVGRGFKRGDDAQANCAKDALQSVVANIIGRLKRAECYLIMSCSRPYLLSKRRILFKSGLFFILRNLAHFNVHHISISYWRALPV